MTEQDATGQTIIIVRRNGFDEGEKPHGGVWKIAYADFMTAMMAFFLVMWLINATSESTRTGVANYFNPIKLSEGTQLPRKGLMDPELAEAGAKDKAGKEDPGPTPDPDNRHPAENGLKSPAETAGGADFSGEALFRDPYAVLAAIGAGASGTSEGLGPMPGRDQPAWAGRESYRDPFYPSGQSSPARPPARTSSPPGASNLPEAAGAPAKPASEPPTGTNHDRQGAGETTPTEKPPETAAGARAAGDVLRRAAMNGPENHAGAGTGAADGPNGAATDAEQLLSRLIDGTSERPMPGITVTRGDKGMLISLSDQADFGMFAIGSAKPLPQTVTIMARIATVLEEMPGDVIIRGHTDARPFRPGTSDNWRLSAARAYMACQMLIRGGLNAARVIRLEAHADHDLKLPENPEAAENRRIEILVRKVPS